MLRQAILSSRRSLPLLRASNRQYAAAKKGSNTGAKRALSEEQLKGTATSVKPVKPPVAAATVPPHKPTANATTPPPSGPAAGAMETGGAGGSDPSSGGGEIMLPIAVASTTLAAAWYFNVIPGFGREQPPPLIPKQRQPEPVIVDTSLAPVDLDVDVAVATTAATTAAAVEEEEYVVVEEEKAPVPEEPSPEEVAEATKVLQEALSPEPFVEEVVSLVVKKEPVPEPVIDPTPEPEPEPEPEPLIVLASVEEATRELMASKASTSSKTLQKAHQALRSTVDESLYSDLENLSPAKLRVRVVQLGTEMTERTKWEAVRLKEFLAMKEKEVGDQYMELMQKQRMEFEDILARKLREQEDAMSRQTNAALQQKDAGIQAVVTATTDSLEAEHKANLESTKELMETELTAKYEVNYFNKLAEEKQQFTDELEGRVSTIEKLSERLEQMQSALTVSRSFTDGSVKAHRVSAAAIALADKLETNKGAKAEVGALEIVADENTVIASAVKLIPGSIKGGIPTLSELQTKFGKVYEKSRQAALVPAGRAGLEGQLMGVIFKTLKYAPNADDPAPEESKDDAEYVLARSQRHVQMGELERAVEQLNKLKGQSAFTVRDWKKSAEDRIAADKALHIIKMEVALMNQSLSKAVE